MTENDTAGLETPVTDGSGESNENPPTIPVTADVPGELVEWARADYNEKLERAPSDHPIHDRPFPEYLYDVALDAVEIKLRWPSKSGPEDFDP